MQQDVRNCGGRLGDVGNGRWEINMKWGQWKVVKIEGKKVWGVERDGSGSESEGSEDDEW